MSLNKETLGQAGYTRVSTLGNGEHVLFDADGKHEIWFCNQNHASKGLG